MRDIRTATSNIFHDTATTNGYVMLDRFHNATPVPWFTVQSGFALTL